jgi:O-antigen/teichoic acid export membrane protein
VSRRLAVDVAWLWAGYVGRSLAYLGLVIVLTQSLGASGFGQLSLFLAVTLGVAQVAGSWPFLAVPVLSASGRSIAAAFRPAARVAAMGTAALLVVALPIVAVLGSPEPVSLFSLCVYAAALVALQGLYSVFQTEGRMAGIAVTQTAERAVGLAAMLVGVAVATLTVPLAEVLLAASATVACVIAYVRVERRQHLIRALEGAHERHTVATVLDAVGAMAIVSVCAYGVAWIDVFILAAFRPDADVGIYSLAYQVFTFMLQIGSLWVVATLPRHARSSAAGASPREQLPMPRLLLGARLWGAGVVGAAIASGLLLPFAFGDEFRDAITPLMILLSGTVLGFGYFASTPAMVAGNLTRSLAVISVVAVVVNLCLDLVLVPTIGLDGPAIATTAQTIVSTFGVLFIVFGTRLALRLLLAGLPAAAGTAVLAFGVTSPLPLVLAAVAALASLLAAMAGYRRRSAPPVGAST